MSTTAVIRIADSLLGKADSLIESEERARRAVVQSVPFMYAEVVADSADTFIFERHPRWRYVAGLVLGMYIKHALPRLPQLNRARRT